MRRLISAVIISLFAVLAFAMPVLAIADPDTPPSVNAVYVYEDLLEDGDAGVLIDYYLDYAVNPSETATEAYLAVFVDTDGATQLKAVAPYTFQNSGYGRGLIWIYFTAAEVTTYSIDQANEALYEVWLMGNPTLGWAGDPPKTTVGIDYWQTSGDTAVLVALRVLYYADILELAWVLDLVEITSLGSRLTTLGEGYFENAINNLRTIAPAAFAAGTYDPVIEDLDYSTSFGAILTNGTGIAAGSPITLTEGVNNVNVTTVGTFTVALSRGTSGNATSDVGVVTGSPVVLVYGLNTITTTGIGNIVVDVALITTQTVITGTIVGTGLDLTTVAARFGMSRLMFSGLVWFIISVIICAAVYKGESAMPGHRGAGKATMIVFDICIIGGAVLGLLSIIVAALLFIAFGAFTGYIIFFRTASI